MDLRCAVVIVLALALHAVGSSSVLLVSEASLATASLTVKVASSAEPVPASWLVCASAAMRNESASGWFILTVEVKSAAPLNDSVVMYCAGYLESVLTSPLSVAAARNFDESNPANATLAAQLDEWFGVWWEWMQTTAASERSSYWTHVGLVLAQLEGYLDGFNDACPSVPHCKPLTRGQLLAFSPDVMDVISMLLAQPPDWSALSAAQAQRLAALATHCSAFVRRTGADVFVGHATWNVYMGMLRIWKRYDFALDAGGAPSMSFSSYPLSIWSGDDFYITRDLVVVETTNNVFDTALYNQLKPTGTVITWIRAVVANRLATDAAAWASIFADFSSGTNNNMWLAVGMPTTHRQDPELVIAEQMPGLVAITDVSDILNGPQGYWASYNVPYSDVVFNGLGYPQMVAQFGDLYTWARNPRALIFDRNASTVETLDDMRALMRYNAWQTDPLSLGSPANAIASRFDLLNQTAGPYPMGATDAKVLDLKHFAEQRADIVTGPTTDGQPPFAWTGPWTSFPHHSLPSVYDFPWTSSGSEVEL